LWYSATNQTYTLCALTWRPAIPVQPEATKPPKNKPKRSAKPKRDPTADPKNSPADTAAAHEPAGPPAIHDLVIVGPIAHPIGAPVAEWDRTVAEKAEQQRQRIISQTPFPPPPARTMPSDKFFQYWNELITLDVAKYARLFCQRWYPVLLPTEGDNVTGFGKKEAYPSERRYDMSSGPLSEQRILETVGAGDYTLRLNDTRIRPFTQATIAYCEKFATMRDYTQYPPQLDVERLDWSDPANAPYIKWGRSTGVLRDPEMIAEEKEQMAATTIQTELLGQVEKERTRADTIVNAELERTRSELAETKAALERAKVTAAAPAAPAAPASSQASDLMSVVTSVATLASTLTPKTDTSFQHFLDLEKEREITRRGREDADRKRAEEEAGRERARADQLQQQMLTEAKEAHAAPTAVAVPVTAVQILEEEVKKQELLRQLNGGRRATVHNEEDEPRESSADKWAAIITPLAPIIGQTISGMFNLAAHGLNVYSETKYNEAIKASGGEPRLPSHIKTGEPKPGEPLKPSPMPANPAVEQQQRAFGEIMRQVVKLVKPLKRALENGSGGAGFAQEIIESQFTDGRIDYDRIRGLPATLVAIGVPVEGAGVDQFRDAVATCLTQIKNAAGVPETWNELSSIPTFAQFLEDFYNYDELKAAAEQEETT
jgi:hypothetical protein